MSRASLVIAAGALAFLASCAEDPGALVVWIQSDYRAPEELGFVEAEVITNSGLSLLEQQWTNSSLPLSFEVSASGVEPDQALVIEVRGFEAPGGRLLTLHRSRTMFLPGRRLVLSVILYRACEDVWRTCREGQTCEVGVCVDDYRDPNVLSEDPPPAFDGGVVGADAGPAGSDAGPALDGGSDASVGADAGVVDVGAVDAGVCTQVTSAPSIFHRVSLPHDVDLPLVAGDIDGDGRTEFVAASSGGAFSIVDFDACAPPALRSFMTAATTRAPTWVLTPEGPALYIPSDSSVLGFGVADGSIEPLGAVVSADGIRALAAAPSGLAATIVTRQIDWGYLAHRLEDGTNLFHPTSRPVTSELAYLSTTTSSRADFLGVDEAGALLGLRADAPPVFLGSFDGAHSPVVVSAGDRFGASGEDVVAVLVPRGSRLHTGRVERTSFSGSFTVSDFLVDIVGEPIPSFQQGAMRVFVLLADGRVERCSLGGGSFLSCTAPSESSGLSIDVGAVPNATILLGYVSSADDADLIVVSGDGLVSFASGRSLSMEVAPAVDLEKAVTSKSALAPFLLDELGSIGAVLATAHENGELSFVAWRRPPGPATAEELWTMYRRDVTRSAYVP